ncbi:MAG: SGNH/GDSL hydrolase family protein [bacterium]|nr:SGNH/GDSL hydrolase family protein [bacterium]
MANQPNPAFQPVEDTPGLPRVLLLGDSISIGYTLAVRDQLQGKANIHRPPTNCGPSSRGIEQIDDWLGDSPWDVIHFNWGLHDIVWMNEDGERQNPGGGTHQVPIDRYEANLNLLVKRLRQTGAKLTWCATTPVPKDAVYRKPGEEVEYNLIAQRVMNTYKIPINDLYTYALERIDEIQRPANVHFTPEGSAELAKAVVSHILNALN